MLSSPTASRGYFEPRQTQNTVLQNFSIQGQRQVHLLFLQPRDDILVWVAHIVLSPLILPANG